MSNQLREIGEFVVFENPQLHDLQETGLMVPHHAVPQVQLYETGLMISHGSDDALYANLMEIGAMVVHDAAAPTPHARLIHAGLMILHVTPSSDLVLERETLQSFHLTNFSARQGASLKKTSGQVA